MKILLVQEKILHTNKEDTPLDRFWSLDASQRHNRWKQLSSARGAKNCEDTKEKKNCFDLPPNRPNKNQFFFQEIFSFLFDLLGG